MKLAIKFTDPSVSFVNGYEAGAIGCKMQHGLLIVNNNGFPVHSANTDVLKRMCQYYGYIPDFSKVTCEENGAPVKDNLGIEVGFEEYINFEAKKILHSLN